MLFLSDSTVIDIFNAFYFSLIFNSILYFDKIARQVSRNRLCWGATCQEYPDRSKYQKAGLCQLSFFSDTLRADACKNPLINFSFRLRLRPL